MCFRDVGGEFFSKIVCLCNCLNLHSRFVLSTNNFISFVIWAKIWIESTFVLCLLGQKSNKIKLAVFRQCSDSDEVNIFGGLQTWGCFKGKIWGLHYFSLTLFFAKNAKKTRWIKKCFPPKLQGQWQIKCT